MRHKQCAVAGLVFGRKYTGVRVAEITAETVLEQERLVGLSVFARSSRRSISGRGNGLNPRRGDCIR